MSPPRIGAAWQQTCHALDPGDRVLISHGWPGLFARAGGEPVRIDRAGEVRALGACRLELRIGKAWAGHNGTGRWSVDELIVERGFTG